ncbi:MAG: LOG family protein [Patescibacteria group bacterium]|jgi:predicted Rossmann-fold nucleotide-binding protein
MRTKGPEGARESQDSSERRAAYQVAIFGTGGETTKEDKIAIENASQVATRLVENGFSLGTGGYGGVMKAASEAGVEKAEALGLKPEAMVKAFTFEAEKLRPREVKKAGVIRSETLPQRLGHLVDESSAYVVLGGGQGTVVELFTALESERIGQRIGEEEKPVRPVIILDPTLKHTDLLTLQARKEKKLNDPKILDNVYVLGNEPQGAELTEKIVESYYWQSLGVPVDEETQEQLRRYNLGEFMRNQEEFEDGGGI